MSETEILKKQVKKFIDKASEKELKIICRIFEIGEEDWWKQLDAGHRAAITKAIEEADEEKVIPHREMVKKYSRWLKK